MVTSTWRTIAIGAGAGLLVVVIVGFMAMAGLLSGSAGQAAAPAGPVLVMLVMPDAEGVFVPRTIDLYTPLGEFTTVRSIDPSSAASVSGTTAQTLADAYSFGGGAAVAAAFAGTENAAAPGWVVVRPEAWRALVGSDTVHLDLPRDMQVFDGAQLYAYPSGPYELPTDQTPQLLDGASFLSAVDGKSVREQLGDVLASRLASASPSDVAMLQSPFKVAALEKWLNTIRTPRRSGVQ